jgi:hypothetical protein
MRKVPRIPFYFASEIVLGRSDALSISLNPVPRMDA